VRGPGNLTGDPERSDGKFVPITLLIVCLRRPTGGKDWNRSQNRSSISALAAGRADEAVAAQYLDTRAKKNAPGSRQVMKKRAAIDYVEKLAKERQANLSKRGLRSPPRSPFEIVKFQGESRNPLADRKKGLILLIAKCCRTRRKTKQNGQLKRKESIEGAQR